MRATSGMRVRGSRRGSCSKAPRGRRASGTCTAPSNCRPAPATPTASNRTASRTGVSKCRHSPRIPCGGGGNEGSVEGGSECERAAGSRRVGRARRFPPAASRGEREANDAPHVIDALHDELKDLQRHDRRLAPHAFVLSIDTNRVNRVENDGPRHCAALVGQGCASALCSLFRPRGGMPPRKRELVRGLMPSA